MKSMSIWGDTPFLYPQLTFSSPSTCRGWCYPLRRVCLCGHVIWCKLEQQTAKWVKQWCYRAVVAGYTASTVMWYACVSLRYLRKILWKGWSTFILVPLHVTYQVYLYTAVMITCYICKGGLQDLMFDFSSNTTMNVPKASASINMCSVKAPFLRCKTKRQDNKSNVYLLCYSIPFFPFLHSFLTVLFCCDNTYFSWYFSRRTVYVSQQRLCEQMFSSAVH